MERLTIATTFQKSIDSLKTTECRFVVGVVRTCSSFNTRPMPIFSQEEKVAHFTQIAECIESAALRTNVNYVVYLSNALSMLLMFCEELDSVTRMSAEENLNRIIRYSAATNLTRIQYDLFHEIKKNGNERSLRICLNLFAYYCPFIKQRKIKAYATNLLPCILMIAKRKEPQLLETFSEFMRTFSEHLQLCLSENDVLKMLEVNSTVGGLFLDAK